MTLNKQLYINIPNKEESLLPRHLIKNRQFRGTWGGGNITLCFLIKINKENFSYNFILRLFYTFRKKRFLGKAEARVDLLGSHIFLSIFKRSFHGPQYVADFSFFVDLFKEGQYVEWHMARYGYGTYLYNMIQYEHILMGYTARVWIEPDLKFQSC